MQGQCLRIIGSTAAKSIQWERAHTQGECSSKKAASTPALPTVSAASPRPHASAQLLAASPLAGMHKQHEQIMDKVPRPQESNVQPHMQAAL